jgi:TetR/AcrR family transcriptional regulator, transcriptional repressor for nem operon
MPREKEYDRETVLSKAVRVFWARGLAGTSMAQVVQATGLNTASMYQEFGGKEDFYCAVLDAAYQTVYAPMLEPMEKQPGLVALKLYLGKMAEYAASREYCGCIFLNNLAGRNQVPVSVLRKVDHLVRHIHQLLENCVAAAQAAGDLPAGRDPRAVAAYLGCLVQGLTFYGRTARHKPHLPSVIDQALAGLRQ